MSHDPDAQSPWRRLPTYGFRYVKSLTPSSPSLLRSIDYPGRDYGREKPVARQRVSPLSAGNSSGHLTLGTILYLYYL